MTAATRMTPAQKVLDGLSRAYVLLKEHSDQPAGSVVVTAYGRVDVLVSTLFTLDETARRAAVDVLAEAAHLGKARIAEGQYVAGNDQWKIATDVKVARCAHCGGAR
jgi:hypothetical protein